MKWGLSALMIAFENLLNSIAAIVIGVLFVGGILAFAGALIMVFGKDNLHKLTLGFEILVAGAAVFNVFVLLMFLGLKF